MAHYLFKEVCSIDQHVLRDSSEVEDVAGMLQQVITCNYLCTDCETYPTHLTNRSSIKIRESWRAP